MRRPAAATRPARSPPRLRAPTGAARPATIVDRGRASRSSTPTTTSARGLRRGLVGRPIGELIALLERRGVATLVDLDGGWGEALRREIARWQASRTRTGSRCSPASTTTGWAGDDRFGETEAPASASSAAPGARGLKVWKLLGLRARDPAGRLVAVDDPRLDPLWATAGDLGLPVLIHVADPIAFFEPLDRANERWEELRAHPDWHFWPTRPRGAPRRAGLPALRRADGGARGVSSGATPARRSSAPTSAAPRRTSRWVSAMLDACPNCHVDIAARIGELGRQPYSAREFFLRWPGPDRVRDGHAPATLGVYRTYYRFLETRDESFPYDADPRAAGPGRGG